MRIACDVDGVVANLHDEWYARYNRDYNDDLTIDRVLHWNLHRFVKPECGKKIYDYLSQPDLYDNVQPIPGALAGIQALRAAGHEVFYVTSCAYGMVDQKARWLERHGFSMPRDGGASLPADLIVANSKHFIDADVLIDDAAHNIEGWLDDKGWGGRAIMIDYPHNRDTSLRTRDYKRVSNWSEVMEAI